MYYPLEAIATDEPRGIPPQIGERFTIQAKMVKIHNEDGFTTVWRRKRIDPKIMIFIGIRDCREGNLIEKPRYKEAMGYIGDDRYFVTKRVIRAWLFVSGIRSKHIFVLPSDAVAIGANDE